MDQVNFRLPAYFQDDMVLQQGISNYVYGQARAQAWLEVKLERFADRQNKLKPDQAKIATRGGFDQPADKDYYGLVFSQQLRTDGRGYFSCQIPAFAGSKDFFRLTLTCAGSRLQIDNICFGEVWLAIGESNMAMPACYTDVKNQLMNYQKQSYLRVFKFTGADFGPDCLPQGSTNQGLWLRADQDDLSRISGIALAFAANLQAKLELPVAIYDLAEPDSLIQSWLSPKAIRSDKIIEKHVEGQGFSVGQPVFSNWHFSLGEKGKPGPEIRQIALPNQGPTMRLSPRLKADQTNKLGPINQPSLIYDRKLAPLSGISIRGLIFAQGESDVDQPLYYRQALKKFTGQIKELCHSFKRGPYFIYSQLAAHFYSAKDDKRLSYFNESLTIARRQLDLQAGLVTIYDLPLDYIRDQDHIYARPLNPIAKEEVGLRMFRLAQGLAYQVNTPRSAPELKYAEWVGDKLLLSFANVGSGLSIPEQDLTIKGFNICSDHSPYLPARANQLYGIKTLIWHPEISKPASCSYAFSTFNQMANLQGENGLPVVPFRLSRDKPDNSLRYDWLACDRLIGWAVPTAVAYDHKLNDGDKPGYFPLWQVSQGQAELRLEYSNKVTGAAALQVHYDQAGGQFVQEDVIFEPVLHYASLYPPLDLSLWTRLELDAFNADHSKKQLALELVDVSGQVSKTSWQTIDDVLAWQKISFIIKNMAVDLKRISRLRFILQTGLPKGDITIDRIEFSGIQTS